MDTIVRKTSFRLICLFVGIATLAGCGPSTPYERPEMTIPAQWSQPVSPPERKEISDWWTAFRDPALNQLIDEALQKNSDLAIAAIRVRRAQLQAGLAEDKMRPQLGAQASAELNRQLNNDRSGRRSSLTGTVAWEVDLWNRLGSEADAARWEMLATEEDRAAAALSLTATVATLYWQIAYLNEKIIIGEESIAYARQTFSLVQAQYAAGGATPLELAEAEQSLESQRASLLSLQQQRVEQRNALAVLFDGPPGTVQPEQVRLPSGVLPMVDAGLPADLLARRPDMRAAELRLRGSLAGVDATRASYYPSLSLTGSLGTGSPALIDILKNPIAALGAGLSLPFLQWHQMELAIAVSKTEYEEAVIKFRQTLYQAMVEVENALAARLHYAEQEAVRQKALAAARTAEKLYETRYRAGSVRLQSWLDAQEKRRSAQIALSDARLNQLNAFIALCQALGGSAQLQ